MRKVFAIEGDKKIDSLDNACLETYKEDLEKRGFRVTELPQDDEDEVAYSRVSEIKVPKKLNWEGKCMAIWGSKNETKELLEIIVAMLALKDMQDKIIDTLNEIVRRRG